MLDRLLLLLWQLLPSAKIPFGVGVVVARAAERVVTAAGFRDVESAHS